MHDADRQVLFQLDDCRETAVPVNDSQLILPRERGRKVDVVGGVGEEGHGASDGNSPGAADFAARRDRGICRVESCRALPHEIFLSTADVESFGGYGLQPAALEIVSFRTIFYPYFSCSAFYCADAPFNQHSITA